MKAKTWILALALAASGYLIYQWLTQPIPDAFAAGEHLLATDTAQVSAIRVVHGSGEILTYSRESDQWLASNGQQSTRIEKGQIRQLLKAVTDLKTESMIPEGSIRGNTVRITLFGESRQEESFQLQRISIDTTWFGFDKLPEKYLVSSELTQPFFRTLAHYRPPRLVEWDSPDSLALVRDSLQWLFYRNDSAWTVPAEWMADSARLEAWVSNLPKHEAPPISAPYDRALPDSLISHQLFVWDGGEQIRVNVYYRDEQWGIWTNQTPDQWYPEIPSRSYQTVFPAWLDSLFMLPEISVYE